MLLDTDALLLFLAAAVISSLITFSLIKSPLAVYFADAPNLRKVHQNIVPRIGGLGIILSVLFCISIAYFAGRIVHDFSPGFLSGILVTSVVILLLGVVDDVRPLSYKTKFACQFALAIALVYGFHFGVEEIRLGGMVAPLGVFGGLLSVLWIVGVTNAFNIIDGVDGLAGVVGIIGLLTIGLIARTAGFVELFWTCVLIAGATAGFLVHNFNRRGKVFLGDTGSLFLGAILAIMCLKITRTPQHSFSTVVPLFIVGYPILDVGVAMIRRYFSKGFCMSMGWRERFLKMFIADNEHMHHRLVHYGMSHLQTTFLLSMVAATMGSAAVIVAHHSGWLQLLLFAYLSIAMTLVLNRLGYVGRHNWLSFPRPKARPKHLLGVVEPDEIFYHSLKNFQQTKYGFHKINWDVEDSGEYAAYIVPAEVGGDFEETWKKALRLCEVKERQVFVIGERQEFRLVKPPPTGFKKVIPVYRPVQIPDFIALLSQKFDKRDWERPVDGARIKLYTGTKYLTRYKIKAG